MQFETILQNWSFFVPANDSITATAKYPTGTAGVPIDISLYASFPHSHKTCTGIINYAYKNTDTIPLIRIPKWDFHWQGQYTFNNMVKFPQGYHLFSGHKFDNTTNNPETPNPNVGVSPGYFTDDEMLFDSYLYTYYLPGDETIDIAGLLAADPLFYPTGVDEAAPTLSGIHVYPNPFTTYTNIDYTLMTAQFVQLTIYNHTGQQVKKLASAIEASGAHRHVWDGRDEAGNKVAAGIYYYTLQAGKTSMNGKVVVE